MGEEAERRLCGHCPGSKSHARHGERWESDPEQLHQLEEKFNAYLSYVQGGYLAREYPHYEGRHVCFALDCAESPRGEAQAMLRGMQDFASGEGIRFVVQVIQGPTG